MVPAVLDHPTDVLSGIAEPDFQDFFENGAVPLHIVDRDGTVIRANRAELDLLGYARDEYVGRRISDFHVDADVIQDILRRLTGGERLTNYPARLRARDGSVKHVLITSSVNFQNGEFLNTRCFTMDVTALRQADAARLEAERRLMVTYEHVTVGIADTDARGGFIRVNAAFEAISGYSRDELLGMTFADLTHPDDQAEDLRLYSEQVEGGRSTYSINKRYVRKDGRIVHVEVQSSTVPAGDGSFLYGVRVVKDITEKRAAEERLRDEERRSRELLDALPMAVYTTDREGRITYFNEAAASLAGRRPQVGVDQWCVTWKLFHVDGRPMPHEHCPLATAIRTGEEPRNVEAVAERPDGTRLTFAPYPTLLRDSRGDVAGAINVLVDITDRKRADEAQKVLIDELNHRVKNTLATVQSIARHTQRSTPVSFQERFEERLLALSKAHDLLTRRRWTGVGLNELLEQELAPYGDTGSGAIELDGAELIVSARVALALGMVIHELATNAAKYGALSSPDGAVRVAWSVQEDGPAQRLVMEWTETGGPPVLPPTRRGFGRRLMERSIGKDLAGVVDLNFDPCGLRCRMEFPL